MNEVTQVLRKVAATLLKEAGLLEAYLSVLLKDGNGESAISILVAAANLPGVAVEEVLKWGENTGVLVVLEEEGRFPIPIPPFHHGGKRYFINPFLLAGNKGKKVERRVKALFAALVAKEKEGEEGDLFADLTPDQKRKLIKLLEEG